MRETLIYTVGSFGSKILSFLLVPLYTFYLTKSEMGEYDLFMTSIALFVPIVSLQLSDAVYRWLVEIDEEETRERMLPTVFTSSFLLLLITYAVFSLGFIGYCQLFGMNNAVVFLILLMLSSMLPFLQSVLRGLGKTKEFAISGLVTTLLIVGLNIILFLFFTVSVKGALIANIVGFGLSSLLIVVKLNLNKCFKIEAFDVQLVKKMLLYSLPLIPNLISWWLISSASKFIILDKLGIEANGVYAIANRFPSMLVLINSVLILPIQDSLLKQRSDFQYFISIVQRFVRFELIVVVLLSVGSPIYVKFMVEDSFYEAWMYMPFLFLGVGFNTLASVIGIIYQKEKKTMRITVTTVIGGIISILLSFLLVSEFGLMGISLSFFAGYLIMFLLRTIDLRHKLNFKAFLPSDMLVFFGFILIMYLQIILEFKMQLLLFIITMFFLFFYYRVDIQKAYNSIRKNKETI